MTFPFPVPEDLTALSADEFAAFATQVREFATALLTRDDADVASLTATRDLFTSVQGEETRRTEEAASAADARATLSAGLAPAPTPAPVVPEVAPAPTPAPVVPEVAPAPVAAASTLDTPPEVAPERFAVLTASSDSPGAGGELADYGAAINLIQRRLSTYSSSTKSNRAVRSLGGHKFALDGRALTRHSNAQIRREYPTDLRITDDSSALRVLDYAASERRLPGGSLRESARRLVEAGRSLTAAVGWCAPSETIYDLCELETLDGILDLPEVEAMRGGFFVPEDGGPDFSTIYDTIGDEGDVILTEYEVQNDTLKICTEIPCPDFVETRLDVAYLCLTGSLLQNRGYPEVVRRFSNGAMVALAHKINESVIARIVAASGGPTVIPTIVGSDDAASQLLSAVELAIEDIKYRHRMGMGTTMEVVLPRWTIVPIRAALARRRGVMAIDVSDAEILAAFATRKAVVRFVYDWQDAYSGLVGGPGGAAPLTALPDDVQFLVYPAGTWIKIVRSVINLDTVYDNALLTNNQYTALFYEDGFNTIQLCPESRLYSVGLNPAGVVGCCEGES